MQRSARMISLLLLALLLALPGSARAEKTTAFARPQIGMNLAGPSDYASELPFVDVFRTSRLWISQKKGAPWGQGPALELDEFGWVKKIEPGCYATTLMCTVAPGHYPAGVYTLFYEGEGKIAIDKLSKAKVLESAPGRMRVEIDTSRGIYLNITETNPANYIRNIRMIMPGFENSWQQDPFHPVFLKRWSGVACLRFMDWMETNGSEVKTWADRPTLRHATFSKRGVALEWMIELCNRLKAAPWFCMPHQADDDYIRNFATMVKEKLDPALPVYIEYSNEVWNSQFKQTHYAIEQGQKLKLGEKPWEAGWHYTALRSMQIFKIWEEVFGGHDRLVRVLPTQVGNQGVSRGILSFQDAAKHADALAIAPYMGFTVGRGKLQNAEEIAGWSVDQLLDNFEKTAFADSLDKMRKDAALARQFGVKLIAYEGGQHMVAMVRGAELTAKLSQTMHEANRHPRMGKMYDQYFETWAQVGGGLFSLFSSIGRWSNFGAWGLMEYYDSNPADYPKYPAVVRAANKWGQPMTIVGAK